MLAFSLVAVGPLTLPPFSAPFPVFGVQGGEWERTVEEEDGVIRIGPMSRFAKHGQGLASLIPGPKVNPYR